MIRDILNNQPEGTTYNYYDNNYVYIIKVP